MMQTLMIAVVWSKLGAHDVNFDLFQRVHAKWMAFAVEIVLTFMKFSITCGRTEAHGSFPMWQV